jgi:hypothetical protein
MLIEALFAGTTSTINKKSKIVPEKRNDSKYSKRYFLLKNVNIQAPDPHPSKAEEIAIKA